jgi:hypothetical protein
LFVLGVGVLGLGMMKRVDQARLPREAGGADSYLLDDARSRLAAEEERAADAGGLLKRLVVAFVLLVVVAVASFVVLPSRGIHVPPMVPLLGFVVIVVGTVLGSPQPVTKKKAKTEEGRALGCCGPRPMRAFGDEDECGTCGVSPERE